MVDTTPPSERPAPRVLIVEDDDDLAEVHRRCVRRVGGEPTVVTTQRQARDAVRACDFKLILTDLRLPDGDGIDLCETLWEARPEQKIVVISGNISNCRSRLDRATAIICKPYGIPEFLDTIRKILRAVEAGEDISPLGLVNRPLDYDEGWVP